MELQELVERINHWKLRQSGEISEIVPPAAPPLKLIEAEIDEEAEDALMIQSEDDSDASVDMDTVAAAGFDIVEEAHNASDESLAFDEETVGNEAMAAVWENGEMAVAEDESAVADEDDGIALESESNEGSESEEPQDGFPLEMETGPSESLELMDDLPVSPVSLEDVATSVETTQEVEALEIVDDEK